MRNHETQTLDRTLKEFHQTSISWCTEALTVLLVGSAAAGYQAATSDLDLEVFTTEDQWRRIGDTRGFKHYDEVSIW